MTDPRPDTDETPSTTRAEAEGRLAALGIDSGALPDRITRYLGECVVNAVGVGSLDTELAVARVVTDMPSVDADPDPTTSCHHLTLPDGTGDTGAVTLTRSGSYVLTGVDSAERLDGLAARLADELAACGIEMDPRGYEVRNLVASVDLFDAVELVAGRRGAAAGPDRITPDGGEPSSVAEEDRRLNLGAAVLALGLTRTEYNPELFPGAIYDAPSGCSALLFNNGSAIVTGGRTFDSIWTTLDALAAELGEHGLV
jgi:TATA-box binding protein (TBP) (component of TFIID and TFIIIB)